MSKIFDGLKKSEGAIAKLTIDVIGGDASPGSAPLGNGVQRDAGGARPAPLRSTLAAGRPRDHSVVALEGAAGDLAEDLSAPFLEAVAQPLDPLDQSAPAVSGVLGGGLETPVFPSAEDFRRASRAPSPEPAAVPEPMPGAVSIRLRAGYPLLPFDTGEADVAAEEYRRIRTKLLQHPSDPRLMLISSPSAGDGKSITALNISGALALNHDARVLLVDVDLRRPTIASLLGLADQAGLAEVLAGTCRLEDAMVRLAPFPNLFLLPAGMDRRNPTELLSSPRWKALCERFRSEMTYIVLDGPPVEAVAEYSLLEERSDGVILVVRTDHTVRSLIVQALKSIPSERLLGTVVNSYRESFFWKQRGDYYS